MGGSSQGRGVEFNRLSHIGIEIVALDLSRLSEPTLRSELYALWLEHGVIVFRGTGADREKHIELSKVFGELEVHPIPKIRVRGQEELVEIKEFGGYYVVDGQLLGGFIPWHQDTCYTPDICKGAILYMDTPAEVGGQTGWIDTAKAYDALPEATRARIEGLEAVMYVHNAKPDGMRFVQQERSFRKPTAEEAPGSDLPLPDFPPVVHPLVVTHPESGRKSLSISPSNIDRVLSLAPEASEALIWELVEHVFRPEFRYVHEWRKGDMVLWDNRRTLHQAYGWPPGVKRVAFRTTLAGAVRSGRYLEDAVTAE